MNIDILKCLIIKDYDRLKEINTNQNDNLAKFYYLYACFNLDKAPDLFSFLDNTAFSDEEVCIIFDALASNHNEMVKEACTKLLDKYKNVIKLENVYKDEEVIDIAKAIKLPKKERKVINLKFYVGCGLVIISLIGLLISLILAFNLKDEIKYFCTVLLLAFPCPVLVLGINFILFKKQNYLLMILEAFMLIYFLSFLCLIKQQNDPNMLVNLKNHLFEVLKALYNFFSYYTFKALEGLE